MAIQAAGRATFTRVDNYSIVFKINGVQVKELNYDTVKDMTDATLEADFLNDGVACVMDKAVITCYDANGGVLGSGVELSDTSSTVIDGGSLYLSKDCETVAVTAYDAKGLALGKASVSGSIAVVRNGTSVTVSSTSYKVLMDVEPGASLVWDKATVYTEDNFPTNLKPGAGKYMYIMTVVTYSDGKTTNTISSSYTPVDGSSVTTKTSVTYAVKTDSSTPNDDEYTYASVPSNLAQGDYLWCKTVVTYTDKNGDTPTISYAVSRVGADGATGYSLHFAYADSVTFDSSGNYSSCTNFSTTRTSTSQWLGVWSSQQVADSTDASVYSWTKIKGDGFNISVKLNGIEVSVLNFDTIKAMTGSVTLQADFTNNGVSYTASKATITCYDGDGNVLGSPITSTDTSSVVIDGGRRYLSKDCRLITVNMYDASNATVLRASKSVTVLRDAQMYKLSLTNSSAAMQSTGSGTSASFQIYANITAKIVKNTGGTETNPTITSISAVTSDGNSWTSGTISDSVGTITGYATSGKQTYTLSNAANAPQAITVTVKADGKTFLGSVPVTIHAGVAIDINNKLGQLSSTVSDHTDSISTMQQNAKSIILKVARLNSTLHVVSYQADQSSNKIPSYAEVTPYGSSVISLVSEGSRGFTVFFLDSENNVQNKAVYDTYGESADAGATAASDMATALNKARSSEGVLVVIGFDACQMTSALAKELEWWGLDSTSVGTWGQARIAFAFVGERNLGKGRGWWATAWGSSGIADLTCKINTGHVVPQYTAGDDAAKTDLKATGVDIENKKIVATADNFVVRNNSGKETAAVDKDGNLQARSLTCADQANSIIMTVANGYFSVLKGKAGVKIGLDSNGIPCLIGTNPNGDTIWSLGQTFDSNALDSKITFTVSSISAEGLDKSSGSLDIIGRYISIVFNVTNKSTSPITIDSTNLYVVVTDEYGVYTVIYDSSTNVAIGSTESLTVMGTAVSKFSAVMASPAGTGVTVDLHYQKKQRLETSTTYKEDTKGELVIDNSTGEWTYSRPFIK